MKAVLFQEFGHSNVLKVGEIPKPALGDKDVLVKIDFTSVNPVDWKIREGYLKDFLPHRFPIVPGWDAAGTVVEVGSGVTRFKAGDRVYAYARRPEVQYGTYAEYVALDESAVSPAPVTIGADAAAAVPLVALTAWQSLHDFAQVKQGETVLVIAAAGGVGGFALQFAKLAGAKVIALARPENHEYVKSLGADVALDYRGDDALEAILAEAPGGVDIVFDGAGGKSLELGFSVVKRGGRLVSIVDTPDEKRAAESGVRTAYVFVAPNGEQLRTIAKLIDDKRLKLPEIRVKDVEEAASAQDANMGRRERGKTVLRVRFH